MKINQFVYFSVFVLGFFQESVHGRPLLSSLPRPRRDDAATFARWLVSQSSWGVLNTISSDWGGAPFGYSLSAHRINPLAEHNSLQTIGKTCVNVVSFSDGLPDKGKGIPYFYLTTLDPTASNALKDQRSSFTLSEYSLGTCGETDPEYPTCAKITLLGKLKLIEGNPNETEVARTALFAKHPDMKSWPKSHNFQLYKLDMENIFMINWFGGPKPLTVEQYLQAELKNLALNLS